MAQMLIRKLDDDILRQLKARARAHGRSAEAEARELLKASLAVPTKRIGSFIGKGKNSGRTVKQIDDYVKKLRREWPQ
jgi:plasmid stability protein